MSAFFLLLLLLSFLLLLLGGCIVFWILAPVVHPKLSGFCCSTQRRMDSIFLVLLQSNIHKEDVSPVSGK